MLHFLDFKMQVLGSEWSPYLPTSNDELDWWLVVLLHVCVSVCNIYRFGSHSIGCALCLCSFRESWEIPRLEFHLETWHLMCWLHVAQAKQIRTEFIFQKLVCLASIFARAVQIRWAILEDAQVSERLVNIKWDKERHNEIELVKVSLKLHLFHSHQYQNTVSWLWPLSTCCGFEYQIVSIRGDVREKVKCAVKFSSI